MTQPTAEAPREEPQLPQWWPLALNPGLAAAGNVPEHRWQEPSKDAVRRAPATSQGKTRFYQESKCSGDRKNHRPEEKLLQQDGNTTGKEAG
jgi:hypothetical protein